jgi:hypothetical protein
VKDRFDVTMAVSPLYFGEAQDAWGMQHALERRGLLVGIYPTLPARRVRREILMNMKSDIHINFHSTFLPSKMAEVNFLFYHEVHDKTDISQIPFGKWNPYDGVFTPAKRFAERMGIDALRIAVDTDMFNVVKPKPEYECDIVFIGNCHQFRKSDEMKEYLLPLKEKGYKLNIYGGGWDRKIFGDSVKGTLPYGEAKYVYASAKVGLNIVCGGMQHWGLGTNRLYQMGACGLPSVSYTCEDYDTYSDAAVKWALKHEDFIRETVYLLENESERKQMSKNILEETLDRNTWDHRVEDLMKILDNPNQEFRKNVGPEHMLPPKEILMAIPQKEENPIVKHTVDMFNSLNFTDIPIEVGLFTGSYRIDDMRNKIGQLALSENYPFVLYWDDDLSPDSGDLLYLIDDIDKDLDIVCGWYKFWNPETNNYEPRVYTKDKHGTLIRCTDLQAISRAKQPIISVEWCAGGIMCISNRVLRAFNKAGIPLFKDTLDLTPEHPDFEKYGKYQRCSEDAWFCHRAHELGFDVHLDTRIYADHVKTAIIKKDSIQVI